MKIATITIGGIPLSSTLAATFLTSLDALQREKARDGSLTAADQARISGLRAAMIGPHDAEQDGSMAMLASMLNPQPTAREVDIAGTVADTPEMRRLVDLLGGRVEMIQPLAKRE